MRNFVKSILLSTLLAFGLCDPSFAINGNITAFGAIQSYTPTFAGATDNPVATYTTQFGRYQIVGSLVYVKFKVVTSTLTKTTLTDAFQITLPVPAATNTGDVQNLSCYEQNSTAVATAGLGEIASGASVATLRQVPLTAVTAAITWAATTPGVGVLTNTITVQCSGWYESAL